MRAKIDEPKGTDFNEFPLLQQTFIKAGIEDTETVNNGGSSKTVFFFLIIKYMLRTYSDGMQS